MKKNNQENKEILLVTVSALFVASGILVVDAEIVYGDLLAKDDIPDLPTNGSTITLGEIDVAVSPYDGYLPQNGTLTLSTVGANDIDFNAMIPEGMTAVITNTSVTLTSHPVTVQQPAAAAAAPTPTTGAAAVPPPASSGGDEDEDE